VALLVGALWALALAHPTASSAGYDLAHPDAVHELPKSLTEISGLTLLGDRYLGAVQDEKGKLYILDIDTGELVREVRFGEDGDYEGVEWTPAGLFILKSDGTLYRIEDWEADEPDVTSIETGLTARYDTEGLSYDAAGRRLLIVCKEYAGKGLKDQKAIYAFDLARGTLVETPAFLIDTEALHRLDTNPINRAFRGALSPVTDIGGFKPAALAIHPENRQLYVISSVLKAAVVLTSDGALLAAVAIPETLFPQPEGLAFGPNGELFVANEGGEGRATLLRFRPR
jgi:uncharacterized protein YjiK